MAREEEGLSADDMLDRVLDVRVMEMSVESGAAWLETVKEGYKNNPFFGWIR